MSIFTDFFLAGDRWSGRMPSGGSRGGGGGGGVIMQRNDGSLEKFNKFLSSEKLHEQRVCIIAARSRLQLFHTVKDCQKWLQRIINYLIRKKTQAV